MATFLGIVELLVDLHLRDASIVVVKVIQIRKARRSHVGMICSRKFSTIYSWRNCGGEQSPAETRTVSLEPTLEPKLDHPAQHLDIGNGIDPSQLTGVVVDVRDQLRRFYDV